MGCFQKSVQLFLGRGSVVDSSRYVYFLRKRYHENNRKYDTAVELFKDFKGYIQSDCYQAYDKVPNATNVACLAHARRKYADFIKACKGELKESNSICLQGIKFLEDLYKIEHKLQKKNASIQEIYEIRNKESKEILKKYKTWLEETYPLLPQKGNLAKALYYSLNNYDNLCNYLLDGRLAIDNNLALSPTFYYPQLSYTYIDFV